jgi:type I restriction-modification system DNA methylase subunit
VADDGRARELAGEAATLAAAAGVTLPDGLRLWALAGGRPLAGHRSASAGPVPLTRSAAARALGDALAARLGVGERRRGAHYTPPALAAVVAGAALGGRRRGEPLVVDPACGGGALLLAAGDRLVADGIDPTRVVAELLFGADVDAVAAAVTEAALALWSGGTPPAPGHVVAADPLLAGRAAWPSAPDAGFDVVVGNPPFQGQLAADTARGAVMRRALRDRFGAAVAGYVDTAALFLLVAVELAAPGGRVGLVQPQSTVAARDGAGVRASLRDVLV